MILLQQPGFSATDVAVVIVSYNTRDLLERCIRSVLAERPGAVFVFDNSSTDGSAGHVLEWFPEVRVVASEANLGYGAAANRAMQQLSFPLVLLLNADTEVQRGCLSSLAAYATENPKAGIVAPAIVDPDGVTEPSCFPFPGTVGWLLENAPLAPIVRRIPALRRRSVSLQAGDAARAVPWVLGAAMLLRRDCMDMVGGFDETFFMYFEEVDLCHRVADAGWEVHHTPAAVVTHVGGASTSAVRTAMIIRHFESTMRYYHRYSTGTSLAFWVFALRLKRLAMLVRDTAQLAVVRNPMTRKRLEEQRRAWAGSLELSREYGRRERAAHAGRRRPD